MNQIVAFVNWKKRKDLYLRNLLTHTLNNLLQKRSGVTRILKVNCLLNKYSISFKSCVKISEQ